MGYGAVTAYYIEQRPKDLTISLGAFKVKLWAARMTAISIKYHVLGPFLVPYFS
jgi:hypothetical protein